MYRSTDCLTPPGHCITKQHVTNINNTVQQSSIECAHVSMDKLPREAGMEPLSELLFIIRVLYHKFIDVSAQCIHKWNQKRHSLQNSQIADRVWDDASEVVPRQIHVTGNTFHQQHWHLKVFNQSIITVRRLLREIGAVADGWWQCASQKVAWHRKSTTEPNQSTTHHAFVNYIIIFIITTLTWQ